MNEGGILSANSGEWDYGGGHYPATGVGLLTSQSGDRINRRSGLALTAVRAHPDGNTSVHAARLSDVTNCNNHV